MIGEHSIMIFMINLSWSHQLADMVVAPISVTLERETVVDFTTPYYDYAGIQILMTKPTTKQDLFRSVH